MYYVHKDHLGSFDKLTNSAGAVVQKTSFDACSAKHGFCEARAKADVERIPARKRSREGRRRNPTNWTYSSIPSVMFSRGYTGHCLSRSSGKHLDQFDLINMNGRIYDPLLGRFLSADKYVQNPFGSQGYNRYSYVSNNPLRFVDPSGWIKQKMDEEAIAEMEAWRNFSNVLSDLNGRFGGGGGGSGSAGFGGGGGGGGSGYRFDGVNYYSSDGSIISYDEVLNNYIIPNSSLAITFNCVKLDWNTLDNNDGDLVGKFSNLLPGTSARSFSETVITISFAQGGGGINGNNAIGLPEWASKTNTGIGAFTASNGVKTELIEYAAKSASLGKTGAQYLKYAKGLGYVGAGLSTTYSIANAGTYYNNGGTDWQVGTKATLDVIMTGVGFLGPIGFGISATYFIIDVSGGFGDFGIIKP